VIPSRRKLFVTFTLLFLTAAGITGLFPSIHAGLTWSVSLPVEQFPGADTFPSALQAQDGTVWLAWVSDRNSNQSATFNRYDILYKTKVAGTWNSYLNFTTTGMNTTPALTQLPNRTIILFWSSNPAGNTCSPKCNIYYQRFNIPTQTWSGSTQLSSGLFNDSLSSTALARDGSLWLFWTRIITTCVGTSCTTTRQLLYRTLNGNTWSPEVQLTNDSNWNWGPSAVFGKDGTLRLAYSKGPPQQNYFQLYVRIYNSLGWGPETRLIISPNPDTRPSIIQDRNGTLWLFYEEEIPISALIFQHVLFSSYSYNNGQSWSTPIQMTRYPSTPTIDAKTPFAIQASDKTIWVFYSSNLTGNGQDYDIYALQSSVLPPVHDVAVSSLRSSATWLYAGGWKFLGQSAVVTFNVTVVNLGDFNETVTVQLSAFNTTTYFLGSLTAPVLKGSSTLFVFSWNTTSVGAGLYSLSATALPVPGETLGNQGDNTLQANRIILIAVVGNVPSAASGGRPGVRV
jgi:hypothetical protein